jgi:agarase
MAEGRFDGENSNYGVVMVNDDAYGRPMQAMTTLNAQAVKIDGTVRLEASSQERDFESAAHH